MISLAFSQEHHVGEESHSEDFLDGLMKSSEEFSQLNLSECIQKQLDTGFDGFLMNLEDLLKTKGDANSLEVSQATSKLLLSLLAVNTDLCNNETDLRQELLRISEALGDRTTIEHHDSHKSMNLDHMLQSLQAHDYQTVGYSIGTLMQELISSEPQTDFEKFDTFWTTYYKAAYNLNLHLKECQPYIQESAEEVMRGLHVFTHASNLEEREQGAYDMMMGLNATGVGLEQCGDTSGIWNFGFEKLDMFWERWIEVPNVFVSAFTHNLISFPRAIINTMRAYMKEPYDYEFGARSFGDAVRMMLEQFG
ncbi:unnamed protein product [Moneuplotes crassus]|uniref:Uncharacterized protein n=1 Tax=Euplotes crassus TaxID=5936 RepID=A0AAD2CYV6_EUPCR|nr:unnamed protein product [Moneuplotes crassus]